MSTVSNWFNLPTGNRLLNESSDRIITDGHVGVEVELENLYEFREDNPNLDPRWRVTEDGSLRNNGVEFVFDSPMFGRDVEEAFINLDATLSEYSPATSRRTSVHVHVDVRDMNIQQLRSMTIAYILAEPHLFALAGEHRAYNPYCIPVAKSNRYLRILAQTLYANVPAQFTASAVRSNLNDRGIKYTAYNLLPMISQGSIEFRHMEGTYNPERLINWVNACLAIKRYGMENPAMDADGLDDLLSNHDEFIREMFDGVRLVEPRRDAWSQAMKTAKLLTTLSSSLTETQLIPGFFEDRYAQFRATHGNNFNPFSGQFDSTDHIDDDEYYGE